jgi:hypothetical protein
MKLLEFGTPVPEAYRFHQISDGFIFGPSANSVRLRFSTVSPAPFAMISSAKLDLPGRANRPFGRHAGQA